MNKLLINADDYGLHPLINEAIRICVEKGSVNSISVMANAEFVDYSSLQEFQRNGVFVGVHLSWVRSKWLTAEHEIFSWREFAWKLLFGGKTFLSELEVEAEMQIKRLSENGIVPDHLDSHQHIHHFPPVWRLAETLAARHGIKRSRCCMVKHQSLKREGIAGVALNQLAAKKFNPDYHFYTAGIRYAGNYSFDKIESELAVNNRSTELIVHPALKTKPLGKIFPDWNFDWEKEFVALTDPRLQEMLANKDFTLCRRSSKNISF